MFDQPKNEAKQEQVYEQIDTNQHVKADEPMHFMTIDDTTPQTNDPIPRSSSAQVRIEIRQHQQLTLRKLRQMDPFPRGLLKEHEYQSIKAQFFSELAQEAKAEDPVDLLQVIKGHRPNEADVKRLVSDLSLDCVRRSAKVQSRLTTRRMKNLLDMLVKLDENYVKYAILTEQHRDKAKQVLREVEREEQVRIEKDQASKPDWDGINENLAFTGMVADEEQEMREFLKGKPDHAKHKVYAMRFMYSFLQVMSDLIYNSKVADDYAPQLDLQMELSILYSWDEIDQFYDLLDGSQVSPAANPAFDLKYRCTRGFTKKGDDFMPVLGVQLNTHGMKDVLSVWGWEQYDTELKHPRKSLVSAIVAQGNKCVDFLMQQHFVMVLYSPNEDFAGDSTIYGWYKVLKEFLKLPGYDTFETELLALKYFAPLKEIFTKIEVVLEKARQPRSNLKFYLDEDPDYVPPEEYTEHIRKRGRQREQYEAKMKALSGKSEEQKQQELQALKEERSNKYQKQIAAMQKVCEAELELLKEEQTRIENGEDPKAVIKSTGKRKKEIRKKKAAIEKFQFSQETLDDTVLVIKDANIKNNDGSANLMQVDQAADSNSSDSNSSDSLSEHLSDSSYYDEDLDVINESELEDIKNHEHLFTRQKPEGEIDGSKDPVELINAIIVAKQDGARVANDEVERRQIRPEAKFNFIDSRGYVQLKQPEEKADLGFNPVQQPGERQTPARLAKDPKLSDLLRSSPEFDLRKLNEWQLQNEELAKMRKVQKKKGETAEEEDILPTLVELEKKNRANLNMFLGRDYTDAQVDFFITADTYAALTDAKAHLNAIACYKEVLEKLVQEENAVQAGICQDVEELVRGQSQLFFGDDNNGDISNSKRKKVVEETKQEIQAEDVEMEECAEISQAQRSKVMNELKETLQVLPILRSSERDSSEVVFRKHENIKALTDALLEAAGHRRKNGGTGFKKRISALFSLYASDGQHEAVIRHFCLLDQIHQQQKLHRENVIRSALYMISLFKTQASLNNGGIDYTLFNEFDQIRKSFRQNLEYKPVIMERFCQEVHRNIKAGKYSAIDGGDVKFPVSVTDESVPYRENVLDDHLKSEEPGAMSQTFMNNTFEQPTAQFANAVTEVNRTRIKRKARQKKSPEKRDSTEILQSQSGRFTSGLGSDEESLRESSYTPQQRKSKLRTTKVHVQCTPQRLLDQAYILQLNAKTTKKTTTRGGKKTNGQTKKQTQSTALASNFPQSPAFQQVQFNPKYSVQNSSLGIQSDISQISKFQ